jgi:hypothetical protein
MLTCFQLDLQDLCFRCATSGISAQLSDQVDIREFKRAIAQNMVNKNWKIHIYLVYKHCCELSV